MDVSYLYVLTQQAWANVDFAKNASWVALLGNSLVQPYMKMSEFQCGTTQSHGGVGRTHTGTNMYLTGLGTGAGADRRD